MKPFKIAYSLGVSEQALRRASTRYKIETSKKIGTSKRGRTVSAGDGTRISRIVEPLLHSGEEPVLVGEMAHPDIEKRGRQGHPISQRAEDVAFYIKSVRRRELLAHEVPSPHTLSSANFLSTFCGVLVGLHRDLD